MNQIYSTVFSPIQGGLFVLALFAFFFVLFVVVPGIKRKRERNGGELLGQVRVVATFGSGGMRFGGVFYRFSIYENYLVACLFSARIYEYREVGVRVPYEVGSNRLNLLLGGVPVTLYGNSGDLRVFFESIRERKSVMPVPKN